MTTATKPWRGLDCLDSMAGHDVAPKSNLGLIALHTGLKWYGIEREELVRHESKS